VVRLLFRRGPFDGGEAEFDRDEARHASKKTRERGEVSFPVRAFVAVGDGAWFAWEYRLSRAINSFSAEYTLCGWKRCDAISRDSPIVLI